MSFPDDAERQLSSPGADENRMTRRDFSRRAASIAAAAAGMFLAGNAMAQQSAPTPPSTEGTEPPGSGAPPKAQPKAPPPAPAPKGLAEAVALVLMSAPGLPEADHKELQDQVKGVMDLSKDLRSHKVADGTEPDFVFRALLPEKSGARRG